MRLTNDVRCPLRPSIIALMRSNRSSWKRRSKNTVDEPIIPSYPYVGNTSLHTTANLDPIAYRWGASPIERQVFPHGQHWAPEGTTVRCHRPPPIRIRVMAWPQCTA